MDGPTASLQQPPPNEYIPGCAICSTSLRSVRLACLARRVLPAPSISPLSLPPSPFPCSSRTAALCRCSTCRFWSSPPSHHLSGLFLHVAVSLTPYSWPWASASLNFTPPHLIAVICRSPGSLRWGPLPRHPPAAWPNPAGAAAATAAAGRRRRWRRQRGHRGPGGNPG